MLSVVCATDASDHRRRPLLTFVLDLFSTISNFGEVPYKASISFRFLVSGERQRVPGVLRGHAAKTKSTEKTQSLAKKIKSGGYVFVFFRKRKTALAFEQKDENGSVLGGLGCSLGRPWEAQEAKRLS